MPLFDVTGVVTGYERHVSPGRAQALQRETHLGKIIGASISTDNRLSEIDFLPLDYIS